MIAKLTSKNQITIPKAALEGISADYYDVVQQDGKIILTPIRPNAPDEVREKMDKLGISESDIADAVEWARRK